MESQREMAVDAYDGVYIRKHKCTLSLKEGCALCYTYIPRWRRCVLLLLSLFSTVS